MTPRGVRSIGPFLTAFTVLSVLTGAGESHGADAEEAQACIVAVEQGQILHRDGKLRKARDRFIACAKTECPGPVRRDCATWLAEVSGSLPSLVFAPRLRDGRELRRGRVFFDGEPLPPDSLNGRAVPVDPGAHSLRFELEGAKPLTMDTVLHEGEKNRLIAPILEPAAAQSAAAQSAQPAQRAIAAPDTSAPAAPSSSRPIPVAAYVTGGAALVGLAGFTFFGLKGRSELSDLRSSCNSDCPQTEVDSARQKLLAGDVFLAGGIVAAGITTWLFLTRPTVHKSDIAFDIQAGPRGATAELRARF